MIDPLPQIGEGNIIPEGLSALAITATVTFGYKH